MTLRSIILYACLSACLFATSALAQSGKRTFGASALSLDNGSNPLRTLTIDAPTLTQSYVLHFPSAAPADPTYNVLVFDQAGVGSWSNNPLPPLAAGAIWYGNAQGVATQLPAGPAGYILAIGANGLPYYTATLPASTSVAPSQITSGTLAPGTTINVAPGSSVVVNGGVVQSNQLVGSGPGKYSGSVPIPQNSLTMTIPYPGIIASSVVIVSIVDPSGQTDGVSVTNITPGGTFTVQFSGFYPTTTGQLNYCVIN